MITGIGVNISVVENLDDSFLLFPGGRVHLEIPSNEKLARHSSDYREGLVGWWKCGLEDDQGEPPTTFKLGNVNHVHETLPLPPSPSRESRALSIPAIHPLKRSIQF